MNIKFTRFLPPSVLCAALALPVSFAHAQVAAPAPPNAPSNAAGGTTAFAAIEERKSKATARGFAIEAPDTLSIPDTAYLIPSGAIFVAPDGRGNGKSAATPMALPQAIEAAPAGATLVLRGGDYRVGSLNLQKKLTIQPMPNQKAWLLGTDVVSGWKRDGALWRHDGWSKKFRPGGSAQDADPDFPLSNRLDMMFLSGRALGQVASREEVRSGRFFHDEAAGALFIGDDPTGKIAEAAARGTGLNVAATGEGAMVRGLGFRGYADRGMGINGRGVTLEKNAFVWNALDGARMWAPDGIVRGNLFACNGKSGFGTWKADRIQFEDNTCSFNNVEGFRKAWSSAGVKFGHTARIAARGNLLEANNAFGMWLDVACDDSLMVHNVARDNAVSGLFFEISRGCVIAFNVSQGNRGAGVHISNSHDALIYNNTLVNNNSAIIVQQGGRKNNAESHLSEGTTIANTPPGGTFTTRGIEIKNNLIVRTAPGKGPLLAINMGSQAPALRRAPLLVTALDSNWYLRAAPSGALLTWSDDGQKAVEYSDLSEFVVTTGLEKNGAFLTGASSIFADAAGRDFRPKAGAAALGRPAILPTLVAKAAGVASNIGYVGALPPLAK